jgi:uncharacterized small protein (DUF1192 family)
MAAARARSRGGHFLPHMKRSVIRLNTQKPIIATEDLVVHDEVLGIDRKIVAGQPVPPDLIEPYRKAGGEASNDENYSDLTVDELQARADQLGVEVDGTGADGKVLKKDLVAALEKRDAAA